MREASHWARPALEVLEDRCVPSTLTVTRSADDVTQNHTLRYAVVHARSGDTIQITAAVKAPIVLTHGELILSQNVTIASVPASTPTISGDAISRVFEISTGANVSLENLNIIDGNGVADNPGGTAADDGIGGAILNLGTLAVSNCTISGSTANTYGGGIMNFTTLAVTGCMLSGNSATYGGGVFINGTATVDTSTFTGNSAVYGGGIFNNAATVTITRCAVSNNSASIDGGGILNDAGTVTITRSTVSNNSAGVEGGSIFNNGGTVTITRCIVSNNSASVEGGGIFNNGGVLNVGTSVFSGDTPDAIVGGYNDLGGNTF
jgi:hypothetical protein